jgi:hypothetical protein
MSGKEHTLQEQVVLVLRLNGYTTICSDMPIASMFLGNHQKKRIAFFAYIKRQGYTNGSPDLIAVKGDKVYFLELKTKDGKLSKEQKIMQDILPNYHVIRDIKDIEAIINNQ